MSYDWHCMARIPSLPFHICPAPPSSAHPASDPHGNRYHLKWRLSPEGAPPHSEELPVLLRHPLTCNSSTPLRGAASRVSSSSVTRSFSIKMTTAVRAARRR